MSLIRFVFMTTVVVSLFGCASRPKTADELRGNVKGGAMFSSLEVFEVNKPYRQVSDALKIKWFECFDSTTNTSFHRGGNTFGSQTNTYKPKSVISAQRTELTLQEKVSGVGLKQLGGPPPDGFFIIVADVYPKGKNATQVDLQKHVPGLTDAMKAIRQWADGTNMGCPDLSQ